MSLRGSASNHVLRVFLGSLFLLGGHDALAQWKQGTISEIYVVGEGGANDKIVVVGTFTSGCTYNGFMLGSTDAYFAQIYAALLSAKLAGTPVQYFHVYCHSSGYARANQYKM